MPNVYIVSKSNHDFSAARKWGELTFLNDGCLPRYQIQQMIRVFTPTIEHSNPNDYIMITGLTVAVSILTSMFSRKHSRLNLLIHRNSSYVERKINWENQNDNS